jgi:Domain of unknown function (DUF4184)
LRGCGRICEAVAVMPFTLAHPAAVLPLRRLKYLQTVPLVIGSVAPDLPYFVPDRWSPTAFAETHTLYGTFSVCLPLGMSVLIAILLLREPLTVLLGPRERWLCLHSLERFLAQPLHWPLAMLSILLGSWTHLAWDSFTHENGWTAARVEALSAPISLFGWDTETTHVLQYLSSLFGLVVLFWWLRQLWLRVPKSVVADPARPRASWLILLVVAFFSLFIGVSRAVLAWNAAGYYHLGYLLLTRTLGWFALSYLTAGLVTLLSRRLEPEPTP